jgi:uncharacterized protein DUF6285
VQDRPDASELAAAVAQFLIETVRPAVPRELRFQVLIAANACAILAREAAAGERPADEELARLRTLLATEIDDAPSGRRELAAAIRRGDFDNRWEEAVEALRQSVRAKLDVAHPGYDALADDGR